MPEKLPKQENALGLGFASRVIIAVFAFLFGLMTLPHAIAPQNNIGVLNWLFPLFCFLITGACVLPQRIRGFCGDLIAVLVIAMAIWFFFVAGPEDNPIMFAITFGGAAMAYLVARYLPTNSDTESGEPDEVELRLSKSQQQELVYPWQTTSSDYADSLKSELNRELPEGHSLYGVKVHAVGNRIDCDDVLFTHEGGLSVVHLTYTSQNSERLPFPTTETFDSWDSFRKVRLEPDIETYNS